MRRWRRDRSLRARAYPPDLPDLLRIPERASRRRGREPARSSLAKDEAWRWSDLSALPDAGRRHASGAVPEALPWLDCDEARGCCSSTAGSTAARSRPGPIAIGPVEADAGDHRAGPAGRPRGLDAAARPRPCAAGLVQIVHVSTGGADHLPAAIELDADAQASIVETFVGEGWANRLTRIDLGQGRPADARPPDPLGERLRQPHRPRRARRRRQPRRHHASPPAAPTPGSTARSSSPAKAPSPRRAAPCSRAAGSVMTPISSSATPRRAAPAARSGARSPTTEATCSVAARVEVARDAQKTDGEQSLKGLLLAAQRDDQRQARARDLRRRRQMRPRRHRRRARPRRPLLHGQPRRPRSRGQGPAHPRLRRRRDRPDRRGGGARGVPGDAEAGSRRTCRWRWEG